MSGTDDTSVTLESLLLPNTPPSIRKNYLTLAQRAQEKDFGPLEEDLVVLDTETTGLSFKNCELLEIACARLSGKKVVDRYHTFVRPKGLIPPEIVALTGIHQSDVADAPSPADAVAGLAEFVGGDLVLAHNATFDRTFVESVPGGSSVSDNWIDTLALSRIALPSLSTHRLSAMAQAFGCDSVTHRAMDDVDALSGMWPIILCGLADMPKGLLAFFADLHPDATWAYRPIFSYLSGTDDATAFNLKQVRRNLLSEVTVEDRADAKEIDGPLTAPSEAEIKADFAPDGPIAAMYGSYEARPEQLAMAEEVRSALATSTHRAIEAGTGVGKSLAYLLPEILFAQRNNVTIGVATKTNALTDQLMAHELPALDQALPEGVSFHALKGYEHYPCLHRMQRSAEEDLPLDMVLDTNPGRTATGIASDMLTALAVAYASVAQSPEGDLDALGIRWRCVPRSMLTTTSNECLRTRCPFFPQECVVYAARRLAASGDVVVTNHSLLLRDVASEGRILPPIRHWVIDEAHAFESEARRQWAVEVSSDDTRAAFELLGGAKSGAIHNAMIKVAAQPGSTLALGLITKASAAVQRASVVTSELFAAIHDLHHLVKGSAYEGSTLWIDEKVRASKEWQAIAAAAKDAHERLDQAGKALSEAQTTVSLTSAQAGNELGESGRFLKDLSESIRLICLEPDSAYVYSAQLQSRKRQGSSEKLVAEKIDIGQDLSKNWLPDTMSAVFTSATIAVGKSFAHFNHAVGFDRLPESAYRDVQLSSSFDYDSNMAVVVAKDLPQPSDPGYLPALEDVLFDIHKAMDGSVLTLFTNRREMEKVFEGLQPRLAEIGLDLVCQEKRSSPRQLRERFISEKSLSLFALKSFWEGFDAAGDTLRCVVVPKLPFASPQDPLVQEREVREQRAWWRYQLPEAVLAVKQAAGRLIRTSTDTGVLVLCDSRLVQKRYGRDFINSMPSKTRTQLECEHIGRYLEMWRSSHEKQ